MSAAVRARALADSAVLGAMTVGTDGIEQAREALAIARALDDSVLLARALTACVAAAAFDAATAYPYLAEALAVARQLGDKWRLSQILAWQSYTACLAGDPVATAAAGEEGYVLADAVGDRFIARMCRYWGRGSRPSNAATWLGLAILRTSLPRRMRRRTASTVSSPASACAHFSLSVGDIAEPSKLAPEAVEAARSSVPSLRCGRCAVGQAALAAGDFAAAAEATDVAWERVIGQPELAIANVMPTVELAFARGDLVEARQLADERSRR